MNKQTNQLFEQKYNEFIKYAKFEIVRFNRTEYTAEDVVSEIYLSLDNKDNIDINYVFGAIKRMIQSNTSPINYKKQNHNIDTNHDINTEIINNDIELKITLEQLQQNFYNSLNDKEKRIFEIHILKDIKTLKETFDYFNVKSEYIRKTIFQKFKPMKEKYSEYIKTNINK